VRNDELVGRHGAVVGEHLRRVVDVDALAELLDVVDNARVRTQIVLAQLQNGQREPSIPYPSTGKTYARRAVCVGGPQSFHCVTSADDMTLDIQAQAASELQDADVGIAEAVLGGPAANALSAFEKQA